MGRRGIILCRVHGVFIMPVTAVQTIKIYGLLLTDNTGTLRESQVGVDGTINSALQLPVII